MAYGIQASLGGVLFIFFVAWISGLLRGYVRLFIVKKFGLDDWLALGSLVCPTPEFMRPITRLMFAQLLLIGPVACYCIGIDFYHLDRPITLQYGTHALAQAGAVIFFSEIFYIIGERRSCVIAGRDVTNSGRHWPHQNLLRCDASSVHSRQTTGSSGKGYDHRTRHL